ncbi:hypothetical protein D5086_016472 [Populus alba]|uniref:Uncharacterized protein n=1 Tax=Populus alba TaxID=43335 RepID=A0ACC4BU95_POPAL
MAIDPPNNVSSPSPSASPSALIHPPVFFLSSSTFSNALLPFFFAIQLVLLLVVPLFDEFSVIKRQLGMQKTACTLRDCGSGKHKITAGLMSRDVSQLSTMSMSPVYSTSSPKCCEVTKLLAPLVFPRGWIAAEVVEWMETLNSLAPSDDLVKKISTNGMDLLKSDELSQAVFRVWFRLHFSLSLPLRLTSLLGSSSTAKFETCSAHTNRDCLESRI